MIHFFHCADKPLRGFGQRMILIVHKIQVSPVIRFRYGKFQHPATLHLVFGRQSGQDGDAHPLHH